MLKIRVIGVLILKNELVVQSIGFKRYLPVGRPDIAVEYLNKWGIDEIAILDITSGPAGTSPAYWKLKEYSKCCHVPLSVGGGVKTLSDIESLIRSGADKVIINTAFHKTPDLITRGAEKFGNQCMVVSIDACRTGKDSYEVYIASGQTNTGKTPVETAIEAQKAGAGEILLNSIDNDGMKKGYDSALLHSVVKAVDIPVIICGGAHLPIHMIEGIRHGASAVAAANFFHYTEHSVMMHKTVIKSNGFDIRTDTYAGYRMDQVGCDGRNRKMNDCMLEELRFEYVPEERI